MSYTVLARRYRSTTFDEVVGQEHIAQTLKRAIETGRIAHAYLFCGTRGTGKTSTARILAKALNCHSSDKPVTVPCNKCDSCIGIARGDDIDVIEIDAASNTGVDNVRELIENSQYRPARSRFKIYIIDEAHMLSKAAFNALLKTLEEPPSHVKFILATTEPEKLLPTILSRCQRYDFRNIPTREIAAHLKQIVGQEKIHGDDDALLLVAKAGAGSMRDSLSLLDRLLSMGERELTVGLIEQLLGLPKAQLIFDLADAIGRADVKAVLTSADAMVQGGLSVDQLLASLVDHFRNLLILRACGSESGLVEVPGIPIVDLATQANRFDTAVLTQDISVLEELRRQIRQSQAGRALLDATLVRLALADQFTSVAELLARVGGAPARASNPGTAQKKTTELTAPAPVAMIAAPVRSSPETEARAAVAAAFSPGPAAPTPAAPPVVAPPPASTMSLDLDETESDDDLPRPGKVWDSSGPSLSELLKQQSGGAAVAVAVAGATPAPLTPPLEEPNIEPVNVLDLGATWQALLGIVASQGPALQGLLEGGQFVGISDGTAIIRYPKGQEHIIKLMERGGKKEIIRDALNDVLQQKLGVKFEVDNGAAVPLPASTAPMPARPVATKPSATPQPTGAVQSPATGQPPAANGTPRPPAPTVSRAAAAPPRPAPEPPRPPDPSIRLTPELREEIEADPLIKAVMESLGGTVVKVE